MMMIQLEVKYYPEDPRLDSNILHRLDEYEADVRECLIFMIDRTTDQNRYRVFWYIGIKQCLQDFAYDNPIVNSDELIFGSLHELVDYISKTVNSHRKIVRSELSKNSLMVLLLRRGITTEIKLLDDISHLVNVTSKWWFTEMDKKKLTDI